VVGNQFAASFAAFLAALPLLAGILKVFNKS
jgi:hypothetical protein